MGRISSNKDVTEKSLVQQQYEVHTDVRVTIAMRWTTNTTTMRERSRRVSPLYSKLSVDAGSNLETKKSSAPSASFVATYHIYMYIREYTTAAAAAAAAAVVVCHGRGGLG